MVSLVNFHANATRIGWYLWEIDSRFDSGLPPGRRPSPLTLLPRMFRAAERQGGGRPRAGGVARAARGGQDRLVGLRRGLWLSGTPPLVSFLIESVFKAVLQKLIPAKIRQLIFFLQ